MSEKKLILVIGATGAQGIAVIDALLAPSEDGNPSPYAVRALTRDPDSNRAQSLKAKGVECVKGSFEDFPVVLRALKGVYGVWANTDSFTVGEAREIYAGIRIFELAKQIGTVRHYIWSSLDYVAKIVNYNPDYRSEHHDGKARVADWMKAQLTDTSNHGMTWSAVTTGPYLDTLTLPLYAPLTQRADGTYVFASPIGDGHVAFVSLRDIGFFARYSFDHRQEVSGRDLAIASEMVGWNGPNGLIETFKRVTGHRAVLVRQSIEEWMNNFKDTDFPVAVDVKGGTTWRQNFSAFWRLWRDDIIKRDMDWIRSINPKGDTLEGWMRTNNYTGELNPSALKLIEDFRNLQLNPDAMAKLALA